MSRVGQFLGKLFAGETGKNEALLRAYGKLPLYAEYRRLDLSPGAPMAFSQWLDQGRLAWAQSAQDGAPGAVRTSRVVLRWPETRDWVVATLWDSRDSLGRRFPFAFFIVCPPEALGNDRRQRWCSCLAVHGYFDQLYKRLAVLGTGGDFYRLYRKQMLPIRPDDLPRQTDQLLRKARQITLEHWSESADLGGLKPGAWFASLRRRAERWQEQSAAAGGLALSCPLARELPYDVQAVLWLEWLSGLRPAADREPGLVIPASDAPGPARMQIVFRDLLPSDFQLLTSDAGAYGYVEDLTQQPAGSAGADSDVEVAIPSGSLLDALAHSSQR